MKAKKALHIFSRGFEETLEQNKWKNTAEEQADTISRYEAIVAGYEELTAELFEMIEGGEE